MIQVKKEEFADQDTGVVQRRTLIVCLSCLQVCSLDAYAHKGDHDRAIQDYNEAIRLNPQFASAFNNRGVAYAHIGKPRYALMKATGLTNSLNDISTEWHFGQRGC